MKNLITRLKAESGKKVVVIGDIMLDEYLLGHVSRISPEAPVPVLKHQSVEWCLGGAANVAINCNHIGCDVTLIGIVGDNDYEGQHVVKLLNDHHMKTTGIVKSSFRPTTCKKRFMTQSQQMLRMDCESSEPLYAAERTLLLEALDKCIVPSSIILISDYAKGVIDEIMMEDILLRARRNDCIIMLDPKGPYFSKYEGVDYIKPNSKEFEEMSLSFSLPLTMPLEERAHQIREKLKLKGLIITRGEKGMVYIDANQVVSLPALKREVYDLTGAGDTVFAFLALGFAHNISREETMKLANTAAAVAVSHLKTYAVSLDELIDHGMDTSEKIYNDWASLKIELDWQRADGRRVIFTNGCFDILHPGHMHILKEAKRLGCLLVVALNSDASVRRLKGPSRPINNLEHRSIMMAALGFVDFVVSFDQDTPQALIEYLRPDVLVKGGDYKKEQVVGYEFVSSYGGTIHIINFIPGLSTTACIEKLANSRFA